MIGADSLQAKAACFYIMKYVVKDGNQLANVLSLIKKADEHLEAHPSLAADVGTRTRTAQHLMTRLINAINSDVEISGQVAASALLGMPSNIFSSDFELCYVLPALAHVQQLIKDGAEQLDDAEPEGVEDLADAVIMQLLAAELDELPLDDAAAGDFDVTNGVEGTYAVAGDVGADADGPSDDTMHVDDESRVLRNFVSQHDTYRHRGEALGDFTLYEFCGVLAVKKGVADSAAVHVGAGRPSNAKFPLDAQHPQSSTHHVVLKSKLDVPILAGHTVPPHPGPRRNDPAWRRRADAFAAYVLTLHAPWNLETGVPDTPLTYESLVRYARQLSTSTSYIDRARLFWIRNLSQVCAVTCFVDVLSDVDVDQGLTVSATALKMLSQWRGRVAHVWNSATDGMQPNADGDDAVDDRNVDDLSAQVLRDLQQKYGSLDPDAAGGSAAHVRAKQVVEQLDAVYGAPIAPGAGGAGAAAIPINAMRHDVSNGDECAAMAKRLREAVALAPQTVAARADGAAGDGGGAVAEPALDDSASGQLNAAQNAALITTMQWLKDDAAYRSACMMRL